jgi:mRNA-degrading endonuclease toxin of MazEF toxin-antitoxin module
VDDAPRIRHGQVYWLDDCPPLDGQDEKTRPGDDTDAVRLPSEADTPQCRTGLTRPCWAIPRWFLPVEKQRLGEPVGYVSGQRLRELTAAVLKRIAEAAG